MKLEDQVTSLELSKKLKELGVKQESLFYWSEFRGEIELVSHLPIGRSGEEFYSAFTVAELGEMLPAWVYTQKWMDNKEWGVFKDDAPDVPEPNEIMSDKSEANARAEMLIYLLENKLI